MIRTVPKSQEFDRVAALPRRVIDLDYAAGLAQELSKEFCAGGAALLPWQGLALTEFAECNGGVLWAPVGMGKELVYKLAPAMLGAERPLLLDQMHSKTLAEHQEYLRKGFKVGTPPRMMTRQELSVERGLDKLYDMSPDLIMVNEHSDYTNSGAQGGKPSGAAMALLEYVHDMRPAVIVGDGTPDRWSMMDYWHLVIMALKDGAPLPLKMSEAKLWAAATDDRGEEWSSSGISIVMPGPLGRSTEAAQAWLAERMRETPGVISLDFDSAGDVPLTIRQVPAPECAQIDEAYRGFLAETPPKTPGDDTVTDTFSQWRLDCQLGCGYYTYWDPAPPQHWRDAYSAKNRLAFEVITAGERNAKTGRPLRTEKAVLSYYADDEIVQDWQRVRKDFDPVKSSRAAWISDATLKYCARWLADPTPGAVWVGSPHFGEALARLSGRPYYGSKGLAADGRELHNAHARDGGIIASWNSNKKGYNLQSFSRALVVQPPPSARWAEQLYGRHHRQGQGDPVTFYFLVTSGLVHTLFEKSIEEARSSKTRTSLTQKILRAEIIRCRAPETQTNMYRWTRAEDQRL